MSITPQHITDALMPMLPDRWGVQRVTIEWTAGGGSEPKCYVRALVGPNPHDVHEVTGMGQDPATSVVDLYSRARSVGRGLQRKPLPRAAARE